MSENNNLIPFARSLTERKTELDKSYFEQFIQPAWDALEKNYSEYVASFKEYIDFLESDEFQYETLLERIQSESIQAQSLRTDFIRVLTQIPSSKSHTKTGLFNSVMSFILSIEEYLGIQGIAAASFEINCGRNDKKQAKNFLDKALVEIEGQYQKVTSEYKKIRTTSTLI